MRTATLEDLLKKAEDSELLDIYNELDTCIVPATGYAHAYCRKVNKLIDAGKLCVREGSYRKVYLPTLAKAVLKEMASRYANYCFNMKPVELGHRHADDDIGGESDVVKCRWCDEVFDKSEVRLTDLGTMCEQCITAIRSRGEDVTVYD